GERETVAMAVDEHMAAPRLVGERPVLGLGGPCLPGGKKGRMDDARAADERDFHAANDGTPAADDNPLFCGGSLVLRSSLLATRPPEAPRYRGFYACLPTPPPEPARPPSQATSPSSWTATGVGPGSAACPASRGIAAVWRPCERSPSPPVTSA